MLSEIIYLGTITKRTKNNKCHKSNRTMNYQISIILYSENIYSLYQLYFYDKIDSRSKLLQFLR